MGRLLRLGYSLSMDEHFRTLLLVRNWNSMKPEAYLLRFRGGGFEHEGAISVTGYLHIGGVIGTGLLMARR
jgi:hypothetical protein